MKTVEIYLETENACFVDDPSEIGATLCRVAKQIAFSLTEGETAIRDRNGNTCGFIRITD